MLLIKQGVANILKNKTQMIVFIFLIMLSSILTTGLFISTTRLTKSNQAMGYGTFSYDYSYNYVSTSYDENNIQTISPFFSLSVNYASYGKDINEHSFSTLTIGEETSALQKINLTSKNIKLNNAVEGKLTTNNIDFNETEVDINNGHFGDFFNFNFNENSDFDYSLIGQLYKKYIFNNKVEANERLEVSNLIVEYMQMLYSSRIFENFKQLIVDFLNQKHDLQWDENSIASAANDFINPNDKTEWRRQGITLDDTDGVPTVGELLEQGLDGNVGLIVKNKEAVLNYEDFSYYYGNVTGPENDFETSLLSTGAFRVRNLSDYVFFKNFDLQKTNSDFVSTYYQLLGRLSNFKITTREQTIAWDINKNAKYKFINWKQPYEDKQLKIISSSSYWSDIQYMSETAIITPQYAKKNNLKFDSSIKVGNGASLNVEAYGADTQNIYPTIYDTDFLPNTDTEAIIYVSPIMFNHLFNTADPNGMYYEDGAYQDVSNVLMEYTGTGDKENDLNVYKQYFADNFNQLNGVAENIKAGVTDQFAITTEFNKSESNSPINIRYGLLNKIINYWTIFVIAIIAFFILLVVFITVVLVRKMIEKQQSQIGILKANGYKNSQITISYWAYIFVTLIIGIPFGWLIGTALQIPIMNIFSAYFVLPAKFSFSGWPLLCLVGGFGIIISLAVFLTCMLTLRKPTMELVYPNQNMKTSRILEKLTGKIRLNRFTPRMQMRLLSTSWKDILIFFAVFAIATVTLTLAILTPVTINSFKNEYYENVKFNNESNFVNVTGNSPLSRLGYYQSDEGQDYDPANPDANIANNNLIANFVYLPDVETAVSIDDYAKGVKTGQYDSILFSQYITNMLIQNLGQLKGANVSLGMFQKIIELANEAGVLDKMASLLQTITCTILPTAFGQQAISALPYPVSQLMPNISYCVTQATNGIVPALIKEAWFSEGESAVDTSGKKIGISENEMKFIFGFGNTPYNKNEDELFTGVNALIENGTDDPSALKIYGISNDNMNSMSKETENKLFNNHTASNKINAVINAKVAKQKGWAMGDNIKFSYEKSSMQYNIGDNENPVWIDIDPSDWSYQDSNGTTSIDSIDINHLSTSNQNLNNQNSWAFLNDKGEVQTYNQMKNLTLKLKVNGDEGIDSSNWETPFEINRDGASLKTSLFQTDDEGDNVANNVVEIAGDTAIIHPYDYEIDHNLTDISTLSSVGFPTTWMHEAIKQGLIRTTTETVESNKTMDIIGIQNSYDANRVFINQKDANDLLGYSNVVDNSGNLVWFNGRYSKNAEPADQTKRFVLSSNNGDYSLLDYKNLKSIVGDTDYIFAKKAIITKLANISLLLISSSIVIIILIAGIIVFLMTDWIINKYVKVIAFLRVSGYYIREINAIFLGLFIPFVLLAWIMGFFIVEGLVTYGVSNILLNAGITIPIHFSWLTMGISFIALFAIFGLTFIVAFNKIKHMNIQTIVVME